jgi:hypothetical protein
LGLVAVTHSEPLMDLVADRTIELPRLAGGEDDDV